MAQKKRGLGRGLQALIPEAAPDGRLLPRVALAGSLEDDDGRGLGRGLATCRGDRLDSARALEADPWQAVVAPGHRDEALGRRGQAQVRQGQVRIRVHREVRGDEDGAAAQSCFT